MSYEFCDKVARNDSSGGETDSPDASASSAETENDENETSQADEVANDDGKTGTSDAIDKEDDVTTPDASELNGHKKGRLNCFNLGTILSIILGLFSL